MPIRGDFQTMSPAELLQFLALGNKSGTLEVWSPTVTVRLTLRNGRIVATASTDPNFHLGTYLVRHGYITEAERQQAIASQSELGMSLGKILVTLGAIPEHDLLKILRIKAEEETIALFGWNDAEFVFVSEESSSLDFIPLRIDPVALVLEAGRRADELAREHERMKLQVLAREVVPVSVPEKSPAVEIAEKELLTRAATKRFFVAVQGRGDLQRYHAPDCSHAKPGKKRRRVTFETTFEAESNGLTPCSSCLPHLVQPTL